MSFHTSVLDVSGGWGGNLPGMNRPERFRDFAQKIQQIVSDPSNSQAVLNSLRDLSEGKPAYLQNGTKVEPLLFDSHQNDDDSLLGLYFTTMTMLLEWGIRAFPDYASMSSPSLWDSMAMIDGLRGYKVRCVASMKLARFGSG